MLQTERSRLYECEWLQTTYQSMVLWFDFQPNQKIQVVSNENPLHYRLCSTYRGHLVLNMMGKWRLWPTSRYFPDIEADKFNKTAINIRIVSKSAEIRTRQATKYKCRRLPLHELARQNSPCYAEHETSHRQWQL